MFQEASLGDLAAFRCGHAQDAQAATGCTVVIAPEGAVCGVDVRGGGPATRETDLLKPENMVEKVHAVVLSGGSAFGLEASCGVMDELAQRSIGFELGGACVPIVTSACLFDLLVGENAHPDKAMGRAAAVAAFGEGLLAEGNVGAGTGATVGKLLAPSRAMKSGFGMYGLRAGDLVAVAMVAVNALGHVCDAQGHWIAGCLSQDGTWVLDPIEAFDEAAATAAVAAQAQAADDPQACEPCRNTTLGVVLTNARLTKAQATKCSSMVHDAYARHIKPVHTSNDGDTIFTFASGEVDSTLDVAAVLATEAMQGAIVRTITQTKGAYGLVSAAEL